MNDKSPDFSIVRICPEHMVRIYEKEHFEERAQAGEFRIRVESRPKKEPRQDYKGQLLVANENHYFLDDRYEPKDKRHIVVHAHCFRTEDGTIGASGKVDPKEILLGTTEYRQLDPRNPSCALCVNGDMILPKERFYSSIYRPSAE